MLALPGAAYIYQGEELGLPEVVDLPDDVLTDPIFRRTGSRARIRDGCRVPLPWSGQASPFGFTSGAEGAKPWLPQPEYFAEYATHRALADTRSSWHLYRDGLQLRSALHQLGEGTLRWLDTQPGVLAFARDDLVCAVNFGTAPVPAPVAGTPLLASGPCRPGSCPAPPPPGGSTAPEHARPVNSRNSRRDIDDDATTYHPARRMHRTRPRARRDRLRKRRTRRRRRRRQGAQRPDRHRGRRLVRQRAGELPEGARRLHREDRRQDPVRLHRRQRLHRRRQQDRGRQRPRRRDGPAGRRAQAVRRPGLAQAAGQEGAVGRRRQLRRGVAELRQRRRHPVRPVLQGRPQVDRLVQPRGARTGRRRRAQDLRRDAEERPDRLRLRARRLLRRRPGRLDPHRLVRERLPLPGRTREVRRPRRARDQVDRPDRGPGAHHPRQAVQGQAADRGRPEGGAEHRLPRLGGEGLRTQGRGRHGLRGRLRGRRRQGPVRPDHRHRRELLPVPAGRRR